MSSYRFLIIFTALWGVGLEALSASLVFAEAAALPIERPRALSLADLNGDSKADLVISNADANTPQSAGRLSFYLQKNGTFAEKPDLALTTKRVIIGLTSEDFDQDGKIDLAANDGNRLYLLFGADGWAIPPYGNYDVNAVTAIGDIHVAKNFMGAKRTFITGPTLRLWNGDAKTRDKWGNPGYLYGPVRNDNCIVIPRDINQDDYLDLVALSRTGVEIRVYHGPFFSQKIFAKDCSALVTLPCREQNRLVIGDLDDDGRPDIIATNADESVIFFQAAPMGFPGRVQKLNVGGTPYLADLDGDGVEELALLSRVKRGLAVYRRAPGDKTLTPMTFVAAPTDVAAFGDINGDGRPDFIAGDNNSVRLLLNASR